MILHIFLKKMCCDVFSKNKKFSLEVLSEFDIDFSLHESIGPLLSAHLRIQEAG